MDDEITIVLKEDAALVLFDWLATSSEANRQVVDSAQQRVLWDLESLLESKLPMLFATDYGHQVSEAKRRISDAND